MSFPGYLFSKWTWQMAWRDSRASRLKLLLFSGSIVLGIAALVAINSLGENLRSGIDQQAKGLLGADLVLSSRDPFTPEMEELFGKIGGVQAREVVFSSMAFFPASGGTRLAQVRALGEGFPFYGQFETGPAGAMEAFHQGGALAEESLLLQYETPVGGEVKIGELLLKVVGTVQKVPGENALFSTIAPRVYIPLELLPKTGLIREESFARFRIYFKLPPNQDAEELVRQLRPKLEKLGLSSDTVEERKADLGNALQHLNQFLSLGGFVALLLGAIGVATAVHVHIKQKTASVAVLRCLGCTVGQSFSIYLVQAAALGVLGAIPGAALGILVQYLLPGVVSAFIPFRFEMFIAWGAVFGGMAAGFAVCLIFALLPLLALRRISPMAVLRAYYDTRSGFRDGAQWALLLLLATGLLLLARAQTTRWSYALGFVGGIATAFLLLGAAAQGVRALARKVVSPSWPYLWRQGMANLYRPQNRTLLLLLSLGLGVFLVLTLYRTNQALSTGLFPADRESQPNAALFDIQADQTEGVKTILGEQGLPVIKDVPLVTMRLAEVKGESVRKLLRDGSRDIPRWALRREYRSTYRDAIDDSEQLIRGAWPVRAVEGEPIPVSVEEGIAEDLKIGLGDELVFDVQGVPMTNRVVAIRKVDWKRVQPNFFMVFPSGVLEEAPGFHIVTTRVENRQQSAAMQRAVVQKFPNVSVIDLTLVLDTVNAVLGKVSAVIRFMASFTVATGIIVLVASVLTGRYQRMQESILLRTLGASRKQVRQILLVEYLWLGLLAGVTGVLLAEGGSWALARFVFKVSFEPAIMPALLGTAAVTVLTVLTGLVANRGVDRTPPLDILRSPS